MLKNWKRKLFRDVVAMCESVNNRIENVIVFTAAFCEDRELKLERLEKLGKLRDELQQLTRDCFVVYADEGDEHKESFISRLEKAKAVWMEF